MASPITFVAVVQKVQTLADGGIRVTLDLPETAIFQMAELAACRFHGAVLEVVCKPQTKDDGNPRKSRKIHI